MTLFFYDTFWGEIRKNTIFFGLGVITGYLLCAKGCSVTPKEKIEPKEKIVIPYKMLISSVTDSYTSQSTTCSHHTYRTMNDTVHPLLYTPKENSDVSLVSHHWI